MKPILLLYGTAGCHLCEEASTLLTQLGLEWEDIEITADEALLELYGTSIPVLKRMDDERILRWPFRLSDVQQLIQRHP
jgi:hypothetical protein